MAFTYDSTMFKETFEHEFTWLQGFLRNVHRFAKQPALSSPLHRRSWSYVELNQDVNRLAHAFQASGVGRQDVVMYMLLNSPEFIFAYIASHKLGAISCPINYRLSAGEVAAIMEDSQPKVFLYDDCLAKTVRSALDLSEYKPRHLICVHTDAHVRISSEALQAKDMDAYVAGMSTENPIPEAPAHIYDETTRLYTSGTTSRARAVPINNVNEVLSSHDVMMHFPLNATDRTMNMTPWFHRGGLHSGGPTPTLYAGGEVVVLREFNPKNCLRLVTDYKVTFLIGVPSIIALLARAQERDPADLSSLRGIVTMGSPFEKSACEKYRKLFTPNIFNGYGTTETFWNTFLRPYQLPEMAGTAGQACTDDDVRIVHCVEDGHAEPDDLVARDNKEVGEIIIKSPAKSTFCYWNNPEMTSQKFYKGYHYTGDLGTWDEQEFVTIVSRKDDMILCNGENIYPTQIEAVINAHPKVQESAVIGVADRLHGQSIAAYIVPSDPSLTVEEIKRYCVGVPWLSSYKRPRFYTLVKELPHTATGKIKHYELRKMVAKEEGQALAD